nr:Zgc:92620 [Danio rerio]
MYKQWCLAMDQGKIPSEIKALLTGDEQKTPQSCSNKTTKNSKYSSSSGI